MPNNYVHQPIRVHEVKALQDFRRGECAQYENPYVRTGSTLALPNIIIQRPTDGLEVGVSLWTLDDQNAGAMESPGFSIVQLDDPVNSVEAFVFDRGDWDTPGPIEGFYYLLFSTGPSQFWWSDAIYITEAGDVAGYPPDCGGREYVKLRWRNPLCITSGVTELLDEDGLPITRADIIAYPPGMDFFCFLLAGAFVESEWESDNTEAPEDGNGDTTTERMKARKVYNLQGAPVSEAIIDSMRASAFFEEILIYFPRLTDPLFLATDIVVEANSDNRGCNYVYNYKFALKNAGYLLKQGCC
jgi:hypothetical protein